MQNPQRTAYDSPPTQIDKVLYMSNIQQNNWVWLSSASIMLTLKLNFLKIYLTKPYDFVLENFVLDIWKYCSDLLDSEILKMSGLNFNLDMLLSFTLTEKECMKCEKGNWLLQKFETFLPNLFWNLSQIRKNNFHKALLQFTKINSTKLPEN